MSSGVFAEDPYFRPVASSSHSHDSSPLPLIHDGFFYDPRTESRPSRFARARIGGQRAAQAVVASTNDPMRCAVAGDESMKILRFQEPEPAYGESQSSGHSNPRRSHREKGLLGTGPGGMALYEDMNVWPPGRTAPTKHSDVAWGYGPYNNKLVSACQNGDVILWDLNKNGSKIEKFYRDEHDRPVEQVIFNEFNPHNFFTACLDGFVKVWDFRVKDLVIRSLPHTSGVRAIGVSPFMASIPQCIVGLDSGDLVRWDLRSAPGVAANKASNRNFLDKVPLAHRGGVLALDWVQTSNEEGKGWLATGGSDKSVRIWDMSQPVLTNVPIHTLHTPHAVKRVQWRPGGSHTDHATELAVVPYLPGISPLGRRTSTIEVAQAPVASERVDLDADRIEIWDVRREYISKYVLLGGEGSVADFVWGGTDVIWAGYRSGTFIQHDVQNSFAPLDNVSRHALTWDPLGGLSFITDRLDTAEVPFDDIRPSMEKYAKVWGIPPKHPSDVPFQATQTTATVSFGAFFSLSSTEETNAGQDLEIFSQLAQTYVLYGEDRSKVCEMNAQAAQDAGDYAAVQLWEMLRSLLVDPVGSDATDVSPTRPTYETPPISARLPHSTSRMRNRSHSTVSFAADSVSIPSPSVAQQKRPVRSRQSSVNEHRRTRTISSSISTLSNVSMLSPHPKSASTSSAGPSRSPSREPSTPVTPVSNGQSASPSTSASARSRIGPSPLLGSQGSYRGRSHSRTGISHSREVGGSTPQSRNISHRASSARSISLVGEGALDDSDSEADGPLSEKEDSVDEADKEEEVTRTMPLQYNTRRNRTTYQYAMARGAAITSSSSGLRSRSTSTTNSMGGPTMRSPLSQTLMSASTLETISGSPVDNGLLARLETPVQSLLDDNHHPPARPNSPTSPIFTRNPASDGEGAEADDNYGSSTSTDTDDSPQVHPIGLDPEIHSPNTGANPNPETGLSPFSPFGLDSLQSGLERQFSESSIQTTRPAPRRSSSIRSRPTITDSPSFNLPSALQEKWSGRNITTRKVSNQSAHSTKQRTLSEGSGRQGRSTVRRPLGGAKLRVDVIADEKRIRAASLQSLRETLEQHIEEGNVQLAAALANVGGDELMPDRERVERLTVANIDLLDKLRLHTAAAAIRKSTPFEAIKAPTNVGTILYTKCVTCRKLLDQVQPGLIPGQYQYCTTCQKARGRCSICHLPARGLFFFCPVCSHGGHQSCYREYHTSRPLVTNGSVRTSEPWTLRSTPRGSGTPVSDPTSVPRSIRLSTASVTTEPIPTSKSMVHLVGGDSFSPTTSLTMTEESEDGVRERLGERQVESSRLPQTSFHSAWSQPESQRIRYHMCAAGCGHRCWATIVEQQ